MKINMEAVDPNASGNNTSIQFTFYYIFINNIQNTINFRHSVSNELNLSVRLLQFSNYSRLNLSYNIKAE
jgi:hypothetical protein